MRNARARSALGDLIVAILAAVPAVLLARLLIHLHHGPIPMGIAVVGAAVGVASFIFAWSRQPIWHPSRPMQVVVGFLATFGGALLLTR